MTDEKKKDKKDGKDAKKIDDEQLKDIAGGWKTDGTACPDVAPRAGGTRGGLTGGTNLRREGR